MSLLSEAMEKCIMLDKRTVPDGYGGIITTWTEGAEFLSAIVFNSSMEARTASVQGVTSLYTVTTVKAILATNLLIERRMHFLQDLPVFVLVLSELG